MSITEKVKELWTTGNSHRRSFDNEAQRNIALLLGEHYFYVDKAGRVYRAEPSKGRHRLAIPLIKPIWRHEVASITANLPVPQSFSKTQDEKDLRAARLGQRAIDSELARLDFSEQFLRLWSWVTAIGCAHLHIAWNPETNEIEVDIVPHMEVVVDPAVRHSLNEAKWLIHGRVMTPEHVFDRFNKEYKADSAILPDLYRNLQNQTGGVVKKVPRGVLVLRLWHLPSKKYPNGTVLTMVGDEIVEGAEDPNDEKYLPFPYRHNQLPFIDFHHIRIPGRWEGQSFIKDLWSSQKDYNASRSRMAETRNLMSASKWSAPWGSMDDIEKISSESGEIIRWNAVGPWRPEPVPPPQLPSFIFAGTNASMQEMADISGRHEVSRGQLPSAGTPAAAIVALQEADERMMGPVIRGMESGINRFGRQLLGLIQQYWGRERLVRTWSEAENKFIVDSFSGADLQANIDVEVTPGSALPKSKQQLRQEWLDLWDRRIVSNPKIILRALRHNAPDELDEPGVRHAKREHDKFSNAQSEEEFPIVETWHPHEAHIPTHNEFRMTEEFESWEDEKRAGLAQHVEQHEEQEKQQQMELLAMQGLAMQGPLGENSSPASETPTEETQYAGLGGLAAIPPDIPNVIGD